MIILRIFMWFAGVCAFLLLNAVIGRYFGKQEKCLIFPGCLLALLCIWRFGYSLAAVTAFAFIEALAAVAVADIDTMEIPDKFHLILFVIGIVSVWTMPEICLADRVIGIFAASTPLFVIMAAVPGTFGGGDVKLTAASGFLLGWRRSLVSLYLAVLFGGIYGIYLLVTHKKKRKDHFAFGPFLCFGMAVSLACGEQIFEWYLRLCGL